MKKLVLPLLILLCACQRSQTQTELPRQIKYEPTPQSYALSGRKITEASGITYSRLQTGCIWVNQDSGNPPVLFLLQNDGSVKDSLSLTGLTNRDWEDIAIGSGPVDGKPYLYVGEFGDNNAAYQEYSVIRVEEPAAGVQATSGYDQLRYMYEDGPRDAEALLIDNTTKDIYIVTKREAKSRVYKLAYPQSTTEVNEAKFLFELKYGGVVSASASPDGSELLVKTYTQVYHYTKNSSESVEEALKDTALKTLAYQFEPQGEAITFSSNNDGFYTLSEEAMGVVARLYFYRKKQ